MRYIRDHMRHLVCDPWSIQGLHSMASDLGLGRHWFHRDHYDVPKRLSLSIEARTELVSPREVLIVIRNGGGRSCSVLFLVDIFLEAPILSPWT